MMLTPDLWKQFLQMQAPGDAGHARQLPRAERQAVHGHAAAHAGPDARLVHRVSFPNFGAPRHGRARMTTRSADSRCIAQKQRTSLHCSVAMFRSAQVPCTSDEARSRLPRPRVGFVSLGCPEGAGRLRADPHAAARRGLCDRADATTAPTWSSSTPAGFIDAAVEESLDAIGEALAENGKVDRHRLPRRQGRRRFVERRRIRRCSRSPGRTPTAEVMAAVHAHLPKPHDPFVDLVPAAGDQAHAAALRVPEDQRRLQPPLHASASSRRCAAISSAARSAK